MNELLSPSLNQVAALTQTALPFIAFLKKTWDGLIGRVQGQSHWVWYCSSSPTSFKKASNLDK
jgi:hypothetical protein